VHNGFLTVNGEKMSKSLGNFVTVRALLDKGVKGEVIRYAFLKTKYREPFDWSDKLVEDAKKELDSLYRKVALTNSLYPGNFIDELCDDLNTPKAISLLHVAEGKGLRDMGAVLGILQQDPEVWFKGKVYDNSINEQIVTGFPVTMTVTNPAVDKLVEERIVAKKAKNWNEADRIRNELKSQGIILEDKPDGTTGWRRE
jgi:cysteinyl-tRNA synthetase